MPKRLRSYSTGTPVAKRQRSNSSAPIRRYKGQPRSGTVRTAGYYGRYSGPNAELKFFDTALTIPSTALLVAATTAATGLVALIPQGDGESNRDGRQCVVKRISIKGVLTLTPGAETIVSPIAHMYLVLDKQANGVAAIATDIFDSNIPGSAFMKLENSKRFKILKSWQHSLMPTAGVSGAWCGQRRLIKWSKGCNIPLDFGGTTGAISEMRSNNLLLVVGYDNVGGTSHTISLAGQCRLRFTG